jgi:flagellar hook assembly protein FlgD
MGAARLDVFDTSGRLVRALVRGSQSPGDHGATLDGTDEAGRPVGAGVYYLRFEGAGSVHSRRVVLLR